MVETQKFPCYRFTYKWSQDGEQDPQFPSRHEGLPAGRVWNGTHVNKINKPELTPELLLLQLRSCWEHYCEGEASLLNISDVEMKAEYLGQDTWIRTWFQHETIDVGQTDEEALASFEAFVEEKQALNRKHRLETGEDQDFYALMGAEDRWRWHGSNEEGEPDVNVPAPCRCPSCKQQGRIRIGH